MSDERTPEQEHIAHGDELAARGAFAEAIEAYTRAIMVSPGSAPAYVQRGLALQESGESARAMADFERALGLDPAYGLAYYGRGWARHSAGDYEGELVDALRGMELDQQRPGAYLRRAGAAYAGLRRFDEALEAYTNALAINPADAGTLLNRGHVYLETERFDKALADYERALRLDPDWAWALYGRAAASARLGDHARAIADLTRVLEQSPGFVGALRLRSSCYASAGQPQLAVQDIERAAALAPSDPELRRRADRLRAAARPAWQRALVSPALRLPLALLALAFVVVFGIVLLVAPPINARTVVEVSGTLASLSQTSRGEIELLLREHNNVFEIVIDDQRFLDRALFAATLQPGTQVSLLTFRSRAAELGAGTRLPTFQVRTPTVMLLSFSDVSKSRQDALRGALLFGVGLPLTLLSWLLQPELIRLIAWLRSRRAAQR